MPLLSLVRIAGARWAVEESFQAAKGQVGFDHYQVRTWTGWHRHITLALLALLAVIAAAQRPADDGQIPLTVLEIRRLLAAIVLSPIRSIEEILHWSQWRRRHQAIAQRCHYQRRSQP
jgi:hypothetical protein